MTGVTKFDEAVRTLEDLDFLAPMRFSLGTPVSPLLKNQCVKLQFHLERTNTRQESSFSFSSQEVCAKNILFTVDSLLMDTSLKRTRRVGPCLSLLPSFDSL